MRVPGEIHADHFPTLYANSSCQLPDGRWVLARPEPLYAVGERFRLAWLVFTGRADALRWTGQ